MREAPSPPTVGCGGSFLRLWIKRRQGSAAGLFSTPGCWLNLNLHLEKHSTLQNSRCALYSYISTWKCCYLDADNDVIDCVSNS